MSEASSKETKYCIVLMDDPIFAQWKDRQHTFSNGVHFKKSSLSSFVAEDKDTIAHWKEWIGSIKWDALFDKDRFALLKMGTDERALDTDVSTIFRALPLIGPLQPPVNECFRLSGEAIVTGEQTTFKMVQTFSGKLQLWKRAHYFGDDHWKDFQDIVLKATNDAGVLQEWDKAYGFINRLMIAKKLTQRTEAFRSFEAAMTDEQLEFKIPNLVRVIECFVHYHKQQDFERRVLSILTRNGLKLPTCRVTIPNSPLIQLYRLRNDCVHGKPFGFSLHSDGVAKADVSRVVAELEFIAEWLARSFLWLSETDAMLAKYVQSRGDLETAWNGGELAQTHP